MVCQVALCNSLPVPLLLSVGGALLAAENTVLALKSLEVCSRRIFVHALSEIFVLLDHDLISREPFPIWSRVVYLKSYIIILH